MPPLPPIPPHYRITPTERVILGHLANGLTYAQIAATVFRTEGCIKAHVYRIALKLPPMPDVQPLHRVLHWLWEMDVQARAAQDKAA